MRESFPYESNALLIRQLLVPDPLPVGRWEEATVWLEKAIAAGRYETPQFPHMNLGRVYEHLGDYQSALAYYNRALEIAPLYLVARGAKHLLLGKLN